MDRERYALAVTASLAAAASKSLANPAARTLARRRLARTVTVLAAQHAGPQFVRDVRKDAAAALTAVLKADGPVAAQAVMNGIADRHFGGSRTPAVHHASLRAAAAFTPAAKHRAQARLARVQAAAAVAALIDSRRERLLRKHLTATLAAWNALAETIDLRTLAKQIMADEHPGQ